MNTDDVKTLGHDASDDELEPLKTGTPEQHGAGEVDFPEDTDDMGESNVFNGETV